MADFQFIKSNNIWTILAPRRAKRPDEIEKKELVCPFCAPDPSEIIYSLADVLVLKNKFPFAPIHEIVIHSSNHHKNFDELSLLQTQKIFQVFRERFNLHKNLGNVVIFHNFGLEAGASVAHPHSQIVVTPFEIDLQIAETQANDRDLLILYGVTKETFEQGKFEISASSFQINCPMSSQWPDEVWLTLKSGIKNKSFSELNEKETDDLALILRRVVQLLDLRHGHDFSYNFYISPFNFSLRIIPRQKKIGGFELATGIYVNTQSPIKTLDFLRENWNLDHKTGVNLKNKAEYAKAT